jgi:hypothetical protein
VILASLFAVTLNVIERGNVIRTELFNAMSDAADSCNSEGTLEPATTPEKETVTESTTSATTSSNLIDRLIPCL